MLTNETYIDGPSLVSVLVNDISARGWRVDLSRRMECLVQRYVGTIRRARTCRPALVFAIGTRDV